MISNFKGDSNFPHKLLQTNRQGSNLRIGIANNLLPNVIISKTEIYKSKIRQICWLNFWNVNKSWLTVNEKCASTIS